MVKLEIKTTAKNDLAEIALYLKENFAEEAYLKLKADFDKLFHTLQKFPQSGVTKTHFKPFSFIVVNNYYVFYLFENNTIIIQRILHTARNCIKILKLHSFI